MVWLKKDAKQALKTLDDRWEKFGGGGQADSFRYNQDREELLEIIKALTSIERLYNRKLKKMYLEHVNQILNMIDREELPKLSDKDITIMALEKLTN